MKKNIKDHLHLYLGCQFVMKIDNPNSEHHRQLTAPMYFGSDVLHAALCKGDYKIDPILILRPLSSMTEEECDQFGIHYTEGKYNRQCFEADATYGGTFRVYSIESISHRINQMRNAGIDCDGLIDSGLAVTAETLK